jgi:hypothetical protein
VYGSTNGDATHYLAPRQGWFAERVLAVGVIPTSREIRAPKTNSKYSGTQTAPIP